MTKEEKALLEKLKKETASKDKTILWQTKIIDRLLNDRNNWFIKSNETIGEYHKLLDAYNAVINSPFWKISKPIRKTLDIDRGIRADKKEVAETITSREDDKYARWIENNEKDLLETKPLNYNPLFSVVIPVYNVERKMLGDCIESVLQQTYTNWELVLVDDHSDIEEVRETLQLYQNKDKIRVFFREENGGISEASNTGLKKCKGEFVAFLDCDDLLSANALYEVAKLLNENEELDLIYSDEDKISEDGDIRFSPHFKPDWSPDTFLWSNYLNHLSVYRRSVIEQSGLLRKEFDGSQDYDFALRFTEHTDREKIGHISKILYHWRARKESVAAGISAKPYALDAAKRAKEDAIRRRKLDAYLDENAKCDAEPCKYQIVYHNHNEKVSIIIPSKDNPDILRRCINSILTLTEYRNYEIIVVDNGSNDDNRRMIKEYLAEMSAKYIYDVYSFNFSLMCNIGAKAAAGEYLLFLNDDIEVIEGDWLSKMLGQASQPWIGAVGVKLLYPDSTLIQHCGIVNYSFGPSNYLAKSDDMINHYFYRNKANYDVIAVTAACLMISKKKYLEINGFNEKLPNDYNDVDFCFRLLDKGYYNICLNNVRLYHHESYSRGSSTTETKRLITLKEERDLLYRFNPGYLFYDPFYNVNLSQTDIVFGVDVF